VTGRAYTRARRAPCPRGWRPENAGVTPARPAQRHAEPVASARHGRNRGADGLAAIAPRVSATRVRWTSRSGWPIMFDGRAPPQGERRALLL